MTDMATAASPRARLRDPLVAAVLVSVVALLIAVIGLGADRATITAAPAWLKPAKFAVSIGTYCATVAWLANRVITPSRTVRTVRTVSTVKWATAGSLFAEVALIDLQVLRGTSSHFNTATPVDAAIYATMGVLVAVTFVSAAVLTTLVARSADVPALVRAGSVAALLVCLLGMLEAVTMIVHGGHTVGIADAAEDRLMPLTGWSLDHGDLRVAHFVGLHGLQVMLVLAWVLLRRRRLATACAVRLLIVAAVAYSCVVVLLTVEAELGRPLLHPGPGVGAAAALLAAATAVAITLVVRSGAPRQLSRQPSVR